MKNCSICKIEKEYKYFSKDNVTKDGHRPRCKDCEAKRRKELLINSGKKTHVYRRNDINGHKTCGKCNIQKEHKDFNKSNVVKDGFSTYCKSCFSEMFKNDYKKPLKRASVLCNIYKKIDIKKGFYNDLDIPFMIEQLNKNCHYCGEPNNIGLDRVNNNLGHQKSNSVPCCAICNSVKSNIFTEKEMLEIGAVIKNIKKNRNE